MTAFFQQRFAEQNHGEVFFAFFPGLPRETLQRVFNVLDPTETGWVAGVELTYLEAGEMEF